MERYCPKCFKKYSGDETRCPADGKKLVSMVDRDLVGQELDERYKILSLLGRGGMGVVYVAEQAMIGRKVALKVLRREMVQDETTVKRFLTEARAIASLRNPHTITLHDFGITDDGLLYYTMELLEGRPLSRLIAKEGPLDFQRAAGIMLQVLDSLEEAHDKGILHRDLKPDNLFVSQQRGLEHVTVLDFGIAKLAGDASMESITRTGMICGTPAYLAPEQAMGNPAVPASDLYSLSIVFYEMLAGIPPFHETTPMKLLLQHLNTKPALIGNCNPKVQVPASIDAFIQKALEKEPGQRFATVAEYRDALGVALESHRENPSTARLAPLSATEEGTRSIEVRGRGGTERFEPELPNLASAQTDAVPVVMENRLSGAVPDPPDVDPRRAVGDPSNVRLVIPGRPFRKWLVVGAVAFACVAVVLVWRPWQGGDGGESSVSTPDRSGESSVASPAATASPSSAEVWQQAESEAKARLDEAARSRFEAEEMARSLDQARLEAEARAKASADELARYKAEAEAAKTAAETARLKAEEAVRTQSEDAALLQAEAVTKAKAEEEARSKAEDAKKKQEDEQARLDADNARKKKAEEAAKSQASKKTASDGANKESGQTKKKSDAAKKDSGKGKAPAATDEGKDGGFGFRPIEVEKKPDEKKSGDGKEGGFGFRPIEVE